MRKRQNIYNPTEHDEQVKIIQWCDRIAIHRWPSLKIVYQNGECIFPIFAVPNGSDRNAIVGKKLKDEGVRRGVSDLMLLVKTERYPGLILELKRRKTGTVSPEQKLWLGFFEENEYKIATPRGSDQAIFEIENYLTDYRIASR